MDEVNHELVGKLHGYVQWAAEEVWHKDKNNSQKKQCLDYLRKHKKLRFEAAASVIKELCDVVAKKQVPFHDQKLSVHEDLRETMIAIKTVFGQAYAELFVENALYATEMMHGYALELHGVITRQAQLLVAVNKDTYEDYVQQVLYLYGKEQELDEKLQQYAEQAAISSTQVLEHLNQNYFGRMEKLAKDNTYIQDQAPVFIAGYALALCSRTLATIYDSSSSSEAVEAVFLKNLANHS